MPCEEKIYSVFILASDSIFFLSGHMVPLPKSALLM